MAIVDELIAILGFEIKDGANVNKFQQMLDQTAKKADELGKKIGKGVALAATATAGAMSWLGKNIIQTNAQFETYAATLETIEGSQKGAKDAMDWISNFAKTTPYEVNELTAAFVKLRSYGLDPMDGSMTAMGDTAAGMGKTIDQVVEAVADASTFQFERLKELGIVSSQAGKQVTFSWTENGKQMTKTLNKTSDEVTKFLYETWGRKFGGAMERQSKTFTGLMSNLGDRWTDFQRKIGDAGFFDSIKARIDQIGQALDRWEKDGTIDAVATALSTGFTAAADAVGVVFGRIVQHIKFLRENWNELEGTINTIGAILVGLVWRAFPVTFAFGALALAVDDFLTYLQGGESVIGPWIEWLREIIPGTKEVEDAVLSLGGAVGAGLAAAFLIAPGTMAAIVVKLVASIVAALAPALITGLTGLSTSIVTGMAAAFGLASNPVGWAIIIGGVAAGLLAYFRDDIDRLWDSYVKPAIDNGLARLKEWFTGLSLYQEGVAWIQSVLDGMKAAWESVKAWVAGLNPFAGVSFNIPGTNAAANAGANFGRMAGSQGGGNLPVIDSTTNAIQSSVTNNIEVNQTVSGPSAPAEAGRAVQNAVTPPARAATGGSF